MKNHLWIAVLVAIVLAAVPVFGQNPGAPNAPANPPAAGQAPAVQKLTPQQVIERMQQTQAAQIKAALETAGYTDPKVADTLLAFINARTAARAPLRQQSMDLAADARNPKASAAQIGGELQDLKDAVNAEVDRTNTALKTLDSLIGYSKDARLEGLLVAFGIFDDFSTYAGAGRSGFPRRPMTPVRHAAAPAGGTNGSGATGAPTGGGAPGVAPGKTGG